MFIFLCDMSVFCYLLFPPARGLVSWLACVCSAFSKFCSLRPQSSFLSGGHRHGHWLCWLKVGGTISLRRRPHARHFIGQITLGCICDVCENRACSLYNEESAWTVLIGGLDVDGWRSQVGASRRRKKNAEFLPL